MSFAIFVAAWITGASYIVLMYVLAFRLGSLRHSGRAPDAPATGEFIFGWFGWTALAFLFSGRHKQIGDRAVTILVSVCRVLLVIYIPLIATVAWRFWADAQPAN